jgi:hypothetical protein
MRIMGWEEIQEVKNLSLLITDIITMMLLFIFCQLGFATNLIWLIGLIPTMILTWYWHTHYFFMNDTCGGY